MKKRSSKKRSKGTLKARRKNSGTRRRRARKAARSRSRKATSAKKGHARARTAKKAKRTRKRSSSSTFTLAFASRKVARELIDSMRSRVTRRAWRGALRSHPRGGVYIRLPAWRLGRDAARRAQAAVLTRLAYEAGRRRRRFSGAGVRLLVWPR